MAGKGDKPRNCFSQNFRSHYDEIEWGNKVELKTPDEWCKILDIRVLDPDGWREDKKNWNDPISKAEFTKRMLLSTVSGGLRK